MVVDAKGNEIHLVFDEYKPDGTGSELEKMFEKERADRMRDWTMRRLVKENETLKAEIDTIAKVVGQLTFDLRTNMTSVSRYVRDSREKHPTLTEGQFVDRNLKYKRLAEQAVNNILNCLNNNEELRQIEAMRLGDEKEGRV